MSAASALVDRVRASATRSCGGGAVRTRRAAAALLATILSAGGLVWLQPVTPAAAASPGDVTVSIDSINPVVPPTSSEPTPVTFTLTLTNNTGSDLSHVQLRAVRGVPFQSPSALQDDIAAPTAPTGGLDIPIHPDSVDVPAGATDSTSLIVTTTIGTADHHVGICQCANGVYPIWFFASSVDSSGVDHRLGQAHTYLPSFDGIGSDGKPATPAKRQVSWVLPLIDRPHRLLGTTEFVDDDLARSVASGRLERLLEVIEQVGQDGTPVTVVVDPELVDELQIMATRPYTVQTSSGAGTTPTSARGHGRDAASAWLARLRTVVAQDPSVSVTLTPYADPDVQTATQDRLPWSGRLPAAMQSRVEQALGLDSLPPTSLSWPASGALGRAALRSAAREGATSALLPATAVQRSHGRNGLPMSLAELSAYGQPFVAALSQPLDQQLVETAFGPSSGAEALARSELASRLAVRAAYQLQSSRSTGPAADAVVFVPPRRVDPDVTDAVTTIEQTSHSAFARPVSLTDLLSTARAAAESQDARGAGSGQVVASPARLADVPDRGPHFPTVLARRIHRIVREFRILSDLLGRSAAAQSLLDSVPTAVQRLESSAWRTGDGSAGPILGRQLASQLVQQLRGVTDGVYIVRPAHRASYTLASDNSPLPVTVENDTDYTMRIRVRVHTVAGQSGLTAGTEATQRVAPHSKTLVHVPTRVDRSGNISVAAVLTTAAGHPLGKPLDVYVHSTVLGTIGVVITIVAGAVLALAVLIRLARRLRDRRRGGADRTRAASRPEAADQVPVASAQPDGTPAA